MTAQRLKSLVVFAAIFHALQTAIDYVQGRPLSDSLSQPNLIVTGGATVLCFVFTKFYDKRRNRGD